VIPAAAPEEWSLANVPHGEIVEGTIQPSDVSGPFRLVGTAPPRFHPKLQKFLLLSRVVVKSHLPKSQMLATVKEDSELEVRWRTRTHATMECMLSMRKPQGGYGGAFYCRSNGRERPDTDGWYSMRVPLREFKPSTTGEETSAVGSEVRTMVVAAITPDWHDAGIEVAELRIFRPEEKKD
jgi:hypothetical protein